MFDVLYKAIQNTGYTSVVDTVRRMESMGITDLDVYLDVVKPRQWELGLMGSQPAQTPAGSQSRGYAFSQDEGGAVSQGRVVSLYGSTENVPDRGRMQRLSVNALHRVHPSPSHLE